MPLADWQAALDQLYGLANWETRPPGTELSFELDRIRRVLTALGEPQQSWPAVHVAGTNGKGSTCAMLSSALRAAGYRVGLFSSPHLHTVRERIQVDGLPIGEQEVVRWLDGAARIFEAEPALTTFEALTAMAFDHFATCEVDLAVVEVGLGGRLDTTNVVEPAVCAITPIGLDHVKVLGGSLGSIARDKAGILKPGVPAVIAPQPPEAMAVIRQQAEAVGSPLTEVAEAWGWSRGEQSEVGQRFELRARGEPARRYALELGLEGDFQRINAATAVSTLEILAEKAWHRIDRRSITRGLAAARWPARFERFETLSRESSEQGPTLIVDGAHNPPAARSLMRSLAQGYAERPRGWVLGFSRDKDLDEMLDILLERAEPVWAIRASHPRAMPAAELAAIGRARGLEVEACSSPGQGLERALAAGRPGGLVVATGSIFAAAEVRLAWFRQAGLPEPDADPPPELA